MVFTEGYPIVWIHAVLAISRKVASCICDTVVPTLNTDLYAVKGKGKAVPLQAWSGPEGSRKLRFPDFMTMAQDGGKVVSITHRPPLPQGNTPGIHFC